MREHRSILTPRNGVISESRLGGSFGQETRGFYRSASRKALDNEVEREKDEAHTNQGRATATLVGVLLGLSPLVASADAVTSWGYFGPVNGKSYQNQASITTTNPSFAIGGTLTQTQDGKQVASGCIGSDARLFTTGGTLKADSGYIFMSGWGSGQGTAVHYGTHGTYYSYGISAVYNGNGNSYYYTFKSPNQGW